MSTLDDKRKQLEAARAEMKAASERLRDPFRLLMQRAHALHEFWQLIGARAQEVSLALAREGEGREHYPQSGDLTPEDAARALRHDLQALLTIAESAGREAVGSVMASPLIESLPATSALYNPPALPTRGSHTVTFQEHAHFEERLLSKREAQLRQSERNERIRVAKLASEKGTKRE